MKNILISSLVSSCVLVVSSYAKADSESEKVQQLVHQLDTNASRLKNVSIGYRVTQSKPNSMSKGIPSLADQMGALGIYVLKRNGDRMLLDRELRPKAIGEVPTADIVKTRFVFDGEKTSYIDLNRPPSAPTTLMHVSAGISRKNFPLSDMANALAMYFAWPRHDVPWNPDLTLGAYLAHPFPGWTRRFEFVNDKDGRICRLRLQPESVPSSKGRQIHYQIDFALDKGGVPVRRETWAPSVPGNREGEVVEAWSFGDLREVTSGVWFPFYAKRQLEKDGSALVQDGVIEFTINKVEVGIVSEEIFTKPTTGPATVTNEIENKTYFLNASGTRALSDLPSNDAEVSKMLRQTVQEAESQIRAEKGEAVVNSSDVSGGQRPKADGLFSTFLSSSLGQNLAIFGSATVVVGMVLLVKRCRVGLGLAPR